MRKQKLPTPDALALSKLGTARRAGDLAKASVWPFVVGTVAFYVLAAVVWWLWEGADKLAWKKVTGGAFYPSIIALVGLLLFLGIVSVVRAHAQVHAAHRTRAEDAEEREAALIAARDQAPVPAPHEEHLKALLQTFSINVASRDVCDYSDPVSGNQDNRDAIIAHFVTLANSLDEWDRAIARAANATPVLRQWIETRAGELGITEKTLVADRLFRFVDQAAREGKLAAPLLALGLERGLVGDGPDEAVALGKTNLLLVTAEPADDIEHRFTTAEALLQDLFTEAQKSAEAVEIAAAEMALVIEAVPLHQSLKRHKMHAPVAQRVPECPFCVTHRDVNAPGSMDDAVAPVVF
jgi:hypothetical protein